MWQKLLGARRSSASANAPPNALSDLCLKPALPLRPAQSGRRRWVQQLFLCHGMPSCNHPFVPASRNASAPIRVPQALFQVLNSVKKTSRDPAFLLARPSYQSFRARGMELPPALCHQGKRSDWTTTRILPLRPATSLLPPFIFPPKSLGWISKSWPPCAVPYRCSPLPPSTPPTLGPPSFCSFSAAPWTIKLSGNGKNKAFPLNTVTHHSDQEGQTKW